MSRFTVTWSSTHWYRATIDLHDPRYAGLSREDFPCDTGNLSQETLTVLETLADSGAQRIRVDDTEISQVATVHNASAAASDRRQREVELRRKFPYIYALGAVFSSNRAYLWNEAEQADHDGAPSQAAARDEWDRLGTRANQDRALEAETAGTAVVVRDDTGEPIRVWWFIDNWSADQQARLNRIAERLIVGQPALLEKADESDA